MELILLRYYSPELGRYVSEDPIRFESGTTMLQSYVDDVNIWVDVLGLSASTYRVRHYSNKARITGIQKELLRYSNYFRIAIPFLFLLKFIQSNERKKNK